jgi:hypothetical protein
MWDFATGHCFKLRAFDPQEPTGALEFNCASRFYTPLRDALSAYGIDINLVANEAALHDALSYEKCGHLFDELHAARWLAKDPNTLSMEERRIQAFLRNDWNEDERLKARIERQAQLGLRIVGNV